MDVEAKREALAKAEPLVSRAGSGKWQKDEALLQWLEAL